MATTTKKPWTADELRRLPEGWRYEIDEGELVIMTPAGWRHNRVVSQIAWLLTDFVKRHHLGRVITNELGIVLAKSPQILRAVDVAYFTPEQVARIGDEPGFPEVPPALVVEVHDPTEPDLARKVQQYLTAGVQAVWVVDLQSRSLTRHVSGEAPRTWLGPDAPIEEPLVPGFVCRLGDLFDEG